MSGHQKALDPWPRLTLAKDPVGTALLNCSQSVTTMRLPHVRGMGPPGMVGIMMMLPPRSASRSASDTSRCTFCACASSSRPTDRSSLSVGWARRQYCLLGQASSHTGHWHDGGIAADWPMQALQLPAQRCTMQLMWLVRQRGGTGNCAKIRIEQLSKGSFSLGLTSY